MKTRFGNARLAQPTVGALAVTLALAFTLALGFGWRSASAGDPIRIHGFGEATAAPFVTYNELAGSTKDVESFGRTSLGAAGDTVGNRITFTFGAASDAEGWVHGQMSVIDHTLNLWITSDVAVLVSHPEHGAPVGFEGDEVGSFKMASSTTSVVVNGEPRPGWTLVNSPVFDGHLGPDNTVCFELINPDGKKVYQWSANISAGHVKARQ